MVALREQNQPSRPKIEGTIRLQAGSRTYQMSLSRAFRLAHSLLRGREYKVAGKLLEALLRNGGPGPRTSILLAYCKAGEHDYAACNALLKEILTGEQESTIDRLQAAFVFNSVGMRSDAVRELTRVAHERSDLPTTWLLLGDLFAAAGKMKKAALCWMQAIRRDQAGGWVARAAREELGRLKKPQPPP
jgi:predicted Zn-dependent protease